jgi:hypothetical protein
MRRKTMSKKRKNKAKAHAPYRADVHAFLTGLGFRHTQTDLVGDVYTWPRDPNAWSCDYTLWINEDGVYSDGGEWDLNHEAQKGRRKPVEDKICAPINPVAHGHLTKNGWCHVHMPRNGNFGPCDMYERRDEDDGDSDIDELFCIRTDGAAVSLSGKTPGYPSAPRPASEASPEPRDQAAHESLTRLGFRHVRVGGSDDPKLIHDMYIWPDASSAVRPGNHDCWVTDDGENFRHGELEMHFTHVTGN